MHFDVLGKKHVCSMVMRKGVCWRVGGEDIFKKNLMVLFFYFIFFIILSLNVTFTLKELNIIQKQIHTSSLRVTQVSRTVAQTTAPTIDQRIAIISRGTSEETCSEKLVFSAVMMYSHTVYGISGFEFLHKYCIEYVKHRGIFYGNIDFRKLKL